MASNTRFPMPVTTVSAAVLAVLGVQAASAAELEGVTVTGSHILSGGQADALPVRILSRDDLIAAGSPMLIDVIRALPEASGSIGQQNAGQPGKGQGLEGSGSINLRGLGPDRGLVLLNGRRMPTVAGFFVNTNNIPMAAIERIEVLKDAASTTYGSDAITGVVNFVTKSGFDGLEVGGDYTFIDGNDGDYRADVTWGQAHDGWDFMVSAGYQEKSRLEILDRDWATPSYEENSWASWNFSSNPSVFIPVGLGGNGYLAPLGPQTIDTGCAELGGRVLTFGVPYCVNQHSRYESLVNPQETAQVYAELNADVLDGKRLHLETVVSRSRAIQDYPPSFNQPKPIPDVVLPDTINPASFAAGTSPGLFNRWFVPLENPGLAAYAAANPSQFPAGTVGIFIPVGLWRPYFVGGNPFFGDDNPATQTRNQDEFRVSAGLSGTYDNGIDWVADITFGQNRHVLTGYDFTGVEIQLALRGLGGPGCNWQTGTPGEGGCQWLNPMSNAISGAPRYGVDVNPGYDPSVGLTESMADWLMREQERRQTSTVLEVNYMLNGESASLDVGSGALQWAAGLQFREQGFKESLSEYANRERVPCLTSPLDIPLADTCTPTPNTPLGLAVALSPTDVSSKVFAVYGEAMLPITDRIEATLGLRYEDYGSDGGDTLNPQLRFKAHLTDWMMLRGSVGTSFRAPPLTQLAPNATSTIPQLLGQFRAVDTYGNPDLDPEEAFTYSVGLVFQAGGLDAAIDYYNYEVDKILTTEPLNNVVAALFPNGAAGANNCATLDPDFIEQHFVFSGACSAENLIRVNLERINGPKATFDGLDLRASYVFEAVLGGALTLGAAVNHVLSFEFDAFEVGGLAVPGFDAVGYLNFGNLAYALPETKGTAYVNYARGPVNVRWSARYNSSYIDQRRPVDGLGYHIAGRTLHDVAAVVDLPRDLQLTLAVNNVFDKEPPGAWMAYAYDPATADPLGRNYRVGLRMSF